MPNNQNYEFQNELRSIRSEQQFNDFVNRNKDNPMVKKMLEMCKGRDPMQVAQNTAGAFKIPFGEFRKFIGI